MRFFSSKKLSAAKGLEATIERSSQIETKDANKRRFLKLLGLVGAGVGAATLFPHDASAATEGSARLTDSVKLKDSADTQVDIATQSTSDSTKTATEATKTDADSIKTNTDTLVTNSNKFNFTGSNLNISKEGSDAFQVADAQGTRVNPWTDDSVVMLRRLVKVMESHATADTVQRQRVTIDAFNTDTGAVADTGTLNANDVQTSTTLTDSTKASTWLDNAWVYYAVAITAGTGSGQIRMIASSTITTLTLVAAWGVTPDSTSTYEIRNIPSGVNRDSGTASGGSNSLIQIQDSTRTWVQLAGYVVRVRQTSGPEQIRLINATGGSLFTVSLGWTPSLDSANRIDSGTVSTAPAANKMEDSTKAWSSLNGKVVKITSGTGIGQVRYILSNTFSVLTLEAAWTTLPDSTSTYDIYPFPSLPTYQVCDIPVIFSDVGDSTGVARMVSATNSTVGTVTNITSVATIGSYPYQQMHGDKAHEVYQDAIRSQLTFS
jgi:hypothetical protein